MTIKQKLESEIARLESIKADLIKKSELQDPLNSSFIYSTEEISDISDTHGSTPNNLSTVMDVLSKSINEYVDHIRTLPFISSNVIYKERPDADIAMLSSNRLGFKQPISWTEIGENYPFEGVIDQLPLSKYYGSIRKIEITSTPKFRKHGESGEDISFEIKVHKLNLRLDRQSTFRSGEGPLNITISENDLYPDDIFIVGIVPNVNIDSTVMYYRDFTYKMVIYRHDDTTETILNTVGNSSIGNSSIGSDTASGMMILWDFVAVNRMDTYLSNSSGNTTRLETGRDGPILGGRTDGNVLTGMSIGNNTAAMEGFIMSYRENISWYRVLCDERYSLFNMNVSNVQSIVFNNVRPIGHILEEAIDAL